MNNDNKRNTDGLGLIGSISDTNARFALWHGQCLESIKVLACAGHLRSELAVRNYLARIGESVANTDSVYLACTGPAEAIGSRFTNSHWAINCAAFCEGLGLNHLLLVNDFGTMTQATSRLSTNELVQIWVSDTQADRAWPIIGSGTGLGVGGLLPLGGGRWEMLSCKGGHVDLPVTSSRDFALWQGLQIRCGYVSAERALSGNGLLALYGISRALDGVAVRVSNAAEVGTLAMTGDAQTDAVLERFFLWLARIAGDVVLAAGALDGVCATGGIVPCFLERLIANGFAEAFIRRGKINGAYLQNVPAWVMAAGHPGLFGAGVTPQQALGVGG